MYQKFFGLRESPFNVNPDPRYLFLTKQIQEALAGLTYGIQNRKGFILLTGEVGLQSVREVLEAVARLSMAGFDDGQNCFHKAAAFGALSAERQLPPDHCRAQCSLAGIVSRFDSVHVQKRP